MAVIMAISPNPSRTRAKKRNTWKEASKLLPYGKREGFTRRCAEGALGAVEALISIQFKRGKRKSEDNVVERSLGDAPIAVGRPDPFPGRRASVRGRSGQRGHSSPP